MAKLYFKYGTMGCSKSMDLLRTAYNYDKLGMKTIILKPEIDTRDVGVVRSRVGLEMECITFCKDQDLYKTITSSTELEGNIDCVLVDEAQFMEVEQVKQLWEVVVRLDIPVIAYGLRIDYRGEGFQASKELLTLAHSIEEIKTVCKCGSKATHHLLKVNGEYTFSGDGIHVGDTEFTSVCGKCWNRAKDEAFNGK